jgi:hypothetical protein
MASDLPSRVLCNNNGKFSVVDPRSSSMNRFEFDIISYTWGQEVAPYQCGIDGVDWDVTISMEKLEDIKRLMVTAGVQHLWVDCVCIDQVNTKEKAAEISKMYEYYKNAKKCHILLEMAQVWNPQDIVNDLKFLDHTLAHMREAALASEAMGLSANFKARLSTWADKQWTFPVDRSTARSAAIDMGVLNCYSTCISKGNRVLKFFISIFRDTLDLPHVLPTHPKGASIIRLAPESFRIRKLLTPRCSRLRQVPV